METKSWPEYHRLRPRWQLVQLTESGEKSRFVEAKGKVGGGRNPFGRAWEIRCGRREEGGPKKEGKSRDACKALLGLHI
jgi:hypothetical protein